MAAAWLGPARASSMCACPVGAGRYERYLAGEGEQWLRNAIDVGRYALSQQVRGGRATACG